MKSSSCGVRLRFGVSLLIGEGESKLVDCLVNSGKRDFLGKSDFTEGTS